MPHHPRLTLTSAASVAGSSGTNQDRYGYGDHYAFVIDGATSDAGDGGTYAQQLADALTAHLETDDEPLPDVLAGAIRDVANAHGYTDPDCPCATVAMVRAADAGVDALVLGDASIRYIQDDGVAHAMTDERLNGIGIELRQRYRGRLAAGHGYDDEHARILCELRAEERRHRNRDGGYWIASANPEAAHHALCKRLPAPVEIQLFTDGLTLEDVAYTATAEWAVEQAQAREAGDPTGHGSPRSKPGDDKTSVQLLVQAHEKSSHDPASESADLM